MNKLREKIIKASWRTGEGHIPSAFSILDLLWVLYKDVIDLQSGDSFILSKGHGSLGLYAILEEMGLLPQESMNSFAGFDSSLGGHPDRNKISSVKASTGSLGHGFPMAVGVALANKIKHNKNHVYVLVGDGEANEGTIWEAALLAANHSLSNITCIIDYNHSTDRALNMGDIAGKFRSFDWLSLTVDGHNHAEIKAALLVRDERQPVAIIADTIKGKGLKIMENNPAWHHKSPNNDEFAQLISEIKNSLS